jgi:hypothetical protein
MDMRFCKNGNEGAYNNAGYPVPENLTQLNIEIIPQINKFPFNNFIHNNSLHCFIPPISISSLNGQKIPVPLIFTVLVYLYKPVISGTGTKSYRSTVFKLGKTFTGLNTLN